MGSDPSEIRAWIIPADNASRLTVVKAKYEGNLEWIVEKDISTSYGPDINYSNRDQGSSPSLSFKFLHQD